MISSRAPNERDSIHYGRDAELHARRAAIQNAVRGVRRARAFRRTVKAGRVEFVVWAVVVDEIKKPEAAP
jgi:thiazole synthase ThiGH ThiG subunit